MNAETDLRAALLAALRADAALAAIAQRIYDGEPVKAATPWLAITEMNGADWGAKGRDGREIRTAFTLRDEGAGGPERIGAMLARIDAAVRGIGPALLPAWETGSAVLQRSRLVRTGEARWAAIADYRVRLLAAA